MIKHLREQQARLEVEAEAASVLRIKQTRLEESIKSLHKELKEAKKSHSPVSKRLLETSRCLVDVRWLNVLYTTCNLSPKMWAL